MKKYNESIRALGMGGVNIEIIAVESKDVEAVGALARRIWQHAYTEIIPQPQIDYMLAQRYNPQRISSELKVDGIWWDKVTVNGKLAGFAATLRTDEPGEMKLDKLYVDPDCQRMGLGGRLIEHVSARAREEGCMTLILAVNKGNERAIAAYRKNGFEVRMATVVDIGGGFFMDDFIMAKSLV